MNNKPSKKECEECRFIRSGVSKRTGKPYDSFWVCDNEQCPNYKQPSGFKPFQKPIDKAVKFTTLEDKKHQELLEAMRKIYAKIDTLQADFDAFSAIFGNNQIGGKKE